MQRLDIDTMDKLEKEHEPLSQRNKPGDQDLANTQGVQGRDTVAIVPGQDVNGWHVTYPLIVCRSTGQFQHLASNDSTLQTPKCIWEDMIGVMRPFSMRLIN